MIASKHLDLYESCRNILLDSVNCLPDSPHKMMKFAHYQNLVYSIVLGKRAKEIRKEKKLNKNISIINTIGDIDLLKCCGIMNSISAKLKEGKDYQQIKGELKNVKMF